MHGVPADVVAGEGDGVALGHQQPLAAGVDYRRVAADGGAQQDAWVPRLDPGQEPCQQFVGQLTDFPLARIIGRNAAGVNLRWRRVDQGLYWPLRGWRG